MAKPAHKETIAPLAFISIYKTTQKGKLRQLVVKYRPAHFVNNEKIPPPINDFIKGIHPRLTITKATVANCPNLTRSFCVAFGLYF